jgi:hypothetical protein
LFCIWKKILAFDDTGEEGKDWTVLEGCRSMKGGILGGYGFVFLGKKGEKIVNGVL